MVFPSRFLGYEPGNADHEFHPRLGNFFFIQSKLKLFKVAISPVRAAVGRTNGWISSVEFSKILSSVRMDCCVFAQQ